MLQFLIGFIIGALVLVWWFAQEKDTAAFDGAAASSAASSRALGALINSEEIQKNAPGDAWAHMVLTRMFLEARDSPEVKQRLHDGLTSALNSARPSWLTELQLTGPTYDDLVPLVKAVRISQNAAHPDEIKVEFDVETRGRVQLDFNGGVRLMTLATIPIRVLLALNEVRGTLQLHIPPGTDPKCTLWFTQPPRLGFRMVASVAKVSGLSSINLKNLPLVGEYIQQRIREVVERRLVRPSGGVCFHLPIPKIRKCQFHLLRPGVPPAVPSRPKSQSLPPQPEATSQQPTSPPHVDTVQTVTEITAADEAALTDSIRQSLEYQQRESLALAAAAAAADDSNTASVWRKAAEMQKPPFSSSSGSIEALSETAHGPPPPVPTRIDRDKVALQTSQLRYRGAGDHRRAAVSVPAVPVSSFSENKPLADTAEKEVAPVDASSPAESTHTDTIPAVAAFSTEPTSPLEPVAKMVSLPIPSSSDSETAPHLSASATAQSTASIITAVMPLEDSSEKVLPPSSTNEALSTTSSDQVSAAIVATVTMPQTNAAVESFKETRNRSGALLLSQDPVSTPSHVTASPSLSALQNSVTTSSSTSTQPIPQTAPWIATAISPNTASFLSAPPSESSALLNLEALPPVPSTAVSLSPSSYGSLSPQRKSSNHLSASAHRTSVTSASALTATLEATKLLEERLSATPPVVSSAHIAQSIEPGLAGRHSEPVVIALPAPAVAEPSLSPPRTTSDSAAVANSPALAYRPTAPVLPTTPTPSSLGWSPAPVTVSPRSASFSAHRKNAAMPIIAPSAAPPAVAPSAPKPSGVSPRGTPSSLQFDFHTPTAAPLPVASPTKTSSPASSPSSSATDTVNTSFVPYDLMPPPRTPSQSQPPLPMGTEFAWHLPATTATRTGPSVSQPPPASSFLVRPVSPQQSGPQFAQAFGGHRATMTAQVVPPPVPPRPTVASMMKMQEEIPPRPPSQTHPPSEEDLPPRPPSGTVSSAQVPASFLPPVPPRPQK